MLLIQSIIPNETHKQPRPQKRGCFYMAQGVPWYRITVNGAEPCLRRLLHRHHGSWCDF